MLASVSFKKSDLEKKPKQQSQKIFMGSDKLHAPRAL